MWICKANPSPTLVWCDGDGIMLESCLNVEDDLYIVCGCVGHELVYLEMVLKLDFVLKFWF